ncbi:MAG TPA: DNA-processing protein DprA [Fimbriimonadaceae bacterium]|nr:DNA-processing protein DprA [Fimbriimonadaceae bacterium]
MTRALTRNDLLGRTIEEFLRLGAEALREEYRFTRKAAQSWTSNVKGRIKEADALLEKIAGYDIEVVSAADANYPRRIEAIDPDPPGVLFLYGNARLLDSDTFCVMSSRNSPEGAIGQIEQTVEEGVLAGGVLVSGHDTPEYRHAAVVPLRWGAPRVLVLDSGFFQVFGPNLNEEPFRAARLWRYKFDAKTDLAVTWVSPEAGYHRNSNRIRDRLVAALSNRLNFVTVAPGGNMERLAKQALRAGRAVKVSPKAEQYGALAALGAKELST